VPEREQSIVAMLPYLQSNPGRADAYYESLTLPESRQRAATLLYRYWRHSDPERADQYRVAAGIDEGAEDSRLSPQLRMGRLGVTGAIPLTNEQSIRVSR